MTGLGPGREWHSDELVEHLNTTFHRLYESGIDVELFDVISGFEPLSKEEAQGSVE